MGDGRVSPLAYIRFKGVVINGGPGAVVCDLEVVCIAELGGYAGVKGGTVGAARGAPGAVVCVYVMGPGGDRVNRAGNIAYSADIVDGVDRRKNSAARSAYGSLAVCPIFPSGVILAVCHNIGGGRLNGGNREKCHNHKR